MNRRATLLAKMREAGQSGLILFIGNAEAPAQYKDNCYKLLYSGAYIYINKDTNLPIISIAPDNTGITTYEYFTKDVTDEDLKEPDISEYTIQEN